MSSQATGSHGRQFHTTHGQVAAHRGDGNYGENSPARAEATAPMNSTSSSTTNYSNRRWIPLKTQGRTQSLQSYQDNSSANSVQVGWKPPPQLQRLKAAAPPQSNISALTTMLTKLHEIVPQYCQAFQQEPTFENIKAACESVLDVEFDVGESPSGSPSSQKSQMSFSSSAGETDTTSPKRSSSLSPTIPGPSWFIGGSSSHHRAGRHNFVSTTGKVSVDFSVSTQASASVSSSVIRKEWDTLVVQPLLVFAALEALYVDLSHACGVGVANNMARLYEKTKQKLKALRQTVCDPYHDIITSPSGGSQAAGVHQSPNNGSAEKEYDDDHNNAYVQPPLVVPSHASSTESSSDALPSSFDPTFAKNTSLLPTNAASTAPKKQTPSISSYSQMASSLALSLDSLMAVCTARCGLISLQMGLWNWDYEGFELGEAALLSRGIVVTLEAMQKHGNNSVGPSKSSSTTSSSSPSSSKGNISADNNKPNKGHILHHRLIVDYVLNEAQAWLYLMELSDSLMMCRYTSSIILAQKVKTRLLRGSSPAATTTNMVAWMTKLLRSMIGLFPILYDRIDGSTDMLYGFQKSKFGAFDAGTKLEPSEDLVETVEEFLRLEERTGGPPIAITIVLDAATASNWNVDKGFSLSPPLLPTTTVATTSGIETSRHGNQQSATTAPNRTSSIDLFPPIFLRTSRPEGTSAYRNISVQAKQHSSSGSAPAASSPTGRHHAKVPNTRAKKAHEDTHAVWPLNCWEDVLVTLPTDFNNISSSTCTSRVGGSRNNHPSSSLQQWLQADDETLIQSARVNPFMWLVMMTKSSTSGSRWNNRRQKQMNKNTEEEVWPFFNGLLGLLRRRNWFNSKRAVDTRRKGPEPYTKLVGDEFVKDRAEWNEHDVMRLLIAIRETFGLRSRRRGSAVKKSPLQTSASTLSMMIGASPGGGTGLGEGESYSHGSKPLMSQKQRMLSYKSPALRKILPGYQSRTKSKAPSHQLSANAFFLGEDLAHAIETDDDYYDADGDDDDDW